MGRHCSDEELNSCSRQLEVSGIGEIGFSTLKVERYRRVVVVEVLYQSWLLMIIVYLI